MRVIAGSAGSLKLKTPEGVRTRPTTDKIKETLFNILQPDLYDSWFLDLFAGSGSIGIEALSRGARGAVFVEKSPAAVSCIKENLEYTHLAGQAYVLACDVKKALLELEGQVRFDLIYMDPPYRDGAEKRTLEYLSSSSLLQEGGQIIIEAALQTDFSYVTDLGFTVIRVKKYRTNKHVFLVPAREAKIHVESYLSGQF